MLVRRSLAVAFCLPREVEKTELKTEKRIKRTSGWVVSVILMVSYILFAYRGDGLGLSYAGRNLLTIFLAFVTYGIGRLLGLGIVKILKIKTGAIREIKTGPIRAIKTGPSRVREAACAGTFYPSETAALRAEIESHLNSAVVGDGSFPVGLIVPNVSNTFCGRTSAQAFAQLRGSGFSRAILLGVNHYIPITGVALPDWEYFETPYISASAFIQAKQDEAATN